MDDLGEFATGRAGRRLEPPPRDDEPPFERVVGDGRGSSASRDGRPRSPAGTRAAIGRLRRPARQVEGHGPPGDDRSPASPNIVSTTARARRSAAGPVAGTAGRHRAARSRGRRPAARAASDPAATRPRRRRSTRRLRRTRRDARAPPARRGPAAGPARATARRRPRRTRPRTRHVRTARRTEGSSWAAVRTGGGWFTAVLRGRDEPAAVEEGRRTAGVGGCVTSGAGATPGRHI